MMRMCKKMILVLAAALLLSTPCQAAQTILIKAAHGLTEFSGLHQGFVKFKEVLEATSNGEFAVELYPNQQLGGDRELTEAAQLGNLAVAATTSAPLAGFEKDFFIFDVPFMFANRTEAFAFMDGEPGQFLFKKLEKINLVGLGFWENGFRNLTNSRKAVRTVEDVRGIKLRTMENPIHLALWKTLGANPAPMAFGELFTALQQKHMDGQENPFGQIYDNKFYEVQPFITRSHHVYTPFPIIINNEFWHGLSPAHKEIVQSSMKDATAYQRKLAEELDDKAAANLRRAGREIIELTTEQLDAFRKGASPVAQAIKERVSPEAFKLYSDYVNRK